jgi:hypothetical protein
MLDELGHTIALQIAFSRRNVDAIMVNADLTRTPGGLLSLPLNDGNVYITRMGKSLWQRAARAALYGRGALAYVLNLVGSRISDGRNFSTAHA